MEQIRDLLIRAGFMQDDDSANNYSNDYCGIALNYQVKNETVIVDNSGNVIQYLPTNYYALLGWLLEKRMISFQLFTES